MRAGHRLDDNARFAVSARAYNETFVPPFHAGISPLASTVLLSPDAAATRFRNVGREQQSPARPPRRASQMTACYDPPNI